MYILRPLVAALVLATLAACGGGGSSSKPDPVPSTTCSQRLGTGTFVTTTVNNPSVTDSSCPAGSSLTQSGISYTTTTTTWSCPNPNSTGNPVASTSTSAPIVTQAKICTVVPVGPTCAQKLGTAPFINSSQTATVTDNACPAGQHPVQDGLSQVTTSTVYSCPNPAGSDDPVATVSTSVPVPTRPKMCNLDAPINYSTYFRDKTGVTQVNAAGFTGKGVKMVIYDNGFNVDNAALKGRISQTFGDLSDDDPDKASHGTSTAAIAAGAAAGDFPGGVAPGAVLAVSDWDADFQPIINWGAKVYNFSFGYDPETDGASSADIGTYVTPWVSELRAVRNSGAFIAISAGNDEKNSAQILAGIPAFYPDLDNILAVVAMSPLNGTLAPYSNKCGEAAKNFCIAAPGTVNLLLPTVNAGDPIGADSYEWFAGTSAAAPVVSGIAALVYQAFPGMSGRQVRDTLISTATDIGELGVDNVYGVGYINAQKAVLGPAVLKSSFSAAVPDGVTWVFGNAIEGDGGLVKTGGGGLSLTGGNTFSGGTEIRDGRLNLFGALGSDVRLAGGGLWSYGGTVDGDVRAEAGVLGLTAGQSLTIRGDLVFGGAVLQLQSDGGYTSHWQGTVLTAGGISGSAPVTAASDWFSADAEVRSGQLVARLQRKAVTEVLADADATQADSAGNLEQAFGQLDLGRGSAAMRQSAALLQHTDGVRAGAALTALAGQSQTTMKDLVLETSDALLPVLNERLRDIARLDGDTGGAWFVAANPDGRKRADGFLPADIDSTLLAAGIDRHWAGASVGAAVFSADDRIGFDGLSDRVRGDRDGIALYARGQGQIWYWQGLAAYSRFDSSADRSLRIGDTLSQAHSRSGGSGQFLVLEAGRPLAGKFSAALQASADRASLDAYAESGASGLELGFPAAGYSRYLLGPDLRFENALAKGFSWDAQLGYRQVLNAVDTGMRAFYTGLPDTVFTVDGMPYPDGFAHWGLGLAYRRTNAYWYLRGDGQHSGNAERLTLSAGLRIGF